MWALYTAFVFEKANKYTGNAATKALMNSDVAKDLDMPFNHMQWAGAHYLMSRMEEEHSEALQSGACYDPETLYWAGYLYRYWHIYKQESGREIYKQDPVKTMQIVWLMYHTMSPEMAINRLKESYQDKRKK